MRNIVLIGMPGCGKSTVGVVLAKALGMEFVDSDLVIQSTMHATLAQLIEQHGDDGFRDIENRVNASIDVQNSIIATGGSVVYGAEAMAHLKSIGTVVYLRLTCENITERLGDLHARGVTIKPGWTLRDLYNERCPLYEQYADIVQDCDGLRLRDVVAELQKKLKADNTGCPPTFPGLAADFLRAESHVPCIFRECMVYCMMVCCMMRILRRPAEYAATA